MSKVTREGARKALEQALKMCKAADVQVIACNDYSDYCHFVDSVWSGTAYPDGHPNEHIDAVFVATGERAYVFATDDDNVEIL